MGTSKNHPFPRWWRHPCAQMPYALRLSVRSFLALTDKSWFLDIPIEENSCLEQCLQTFDNSIQYYVHVINHFSDIEETFVERLN